VLTRKTSVDLTPSTVQILSSCGRGEHYLFLLRIKVSKSKSDFIMRSILGTAHS
jgi:hypothetical protein